MKQRQLRRRGRVVSAARRVGTRFFVQVLVYHQKGASQYLGLDWR